MTGRRLPRSERNPGRTTLSLHYYNDNDPYVARWVQNLIAAGHVPPGDVDTRSIKEVQADDVRGYAQVHLFCGILGWPLALRLARWPADRPVWTISCPCPPFSGAGKQFVCPACAARSPVPCPRRTGFFICWRCEYAWLADKRHLWPEAWRLVRDARPELIFGEQVAGADGKIWLAGVSASLEIMDFGFGAADLCAAGVGAPHIRQRLFWVAHANGSRKQGRGAGQEPGDRHPPTAKGADPQPGRCGSTRSGGVAHAASSGRRSGNPGEQGRDLQEPRGSDPTDRGAEPPDARSVREGLADTGCRSLQSDGGFGEEPSAETETGSEVREQRFRAVPRPSGEGSEGMADTEGKRRGVGNPPDERPADRAANAPADAGSVGGGLGDAALEGCAGWSLCPEPGYPGERDPWSPSLLVPRREPDGTVVPCRTAPGIFPVAYGIPDRVAKLRALGNSINPHLTAEFIGAYLDVLEG